MKNLFLLYLILLIFSNSLVFNYEPDPSSYSLLLPKVRKDVIKTTLSSLPNKSKLNLLQMSEAMAKLKEEKSLNEAESAYLIYLWIGKNIRLDCYSDNTKYQFPTEVYNNEKGNSLGFTSLFYAFATNLDIKVFPIPIQGKEKITVETKEVYKIVNTTWNAILIDNNYYLVDTKKGTGYCSNEFKRMNTDLYFGTKPEIFIRSHFPDDDKWQLLEDKITFDKFNSWPYISYYFYMNGFQTLSPDDAFLDVSYGSKLVLTYDKENTNLSILTKFSTNYKFTKYKGDNVSNGKVVIAFDGKYTSEDALVIYANQSGPSDTYYTIIIYKIKK